MSDIVGLSARILTRNIEALHDRLLTTDARFEFVVEGDLTEVRYEDKPQARQYVDQYRIGEEQLSV